MEGHRKDEGSQIQKRSHRERQMDHGEACARPCRKGEPQVILIVTSKALVPSFLFLLAMHPFLLIAFSTCSFWLDFSTRPRAGSWMSRLDRSCSDPVSGQTNKPLFSSRKWGAIWAVTRFKPTKTSKTAGTPQKAMGGILESLWIHVIKEVSTFLCEGFGKEKIRGDLLQRTSLQIQTTTLCASFSSG